MQFENLILDPPANFESRGFSAATVDSTNQCQPQQFMQYQPYTQPGMYPDATVMNMGQAINMQQPTMCSNADIMNRMHATAAAYNRVNFGDIIVIEDNKNNSSVGINVDGLVTHPDKRAKNTVGLDIDSLTIKEEPIPANYEAPQQIPAFEGLVNQYSYTPEQKFAIQPIPIDMDRSMLPSPTLVSNAIDEVNAHLSKNNDQKSNKKINNWFTRIMEQKGEDYFSAGRVSVDEISRNAEKIFDDMISGRIDYNKQGQIIIQPVIIETLINYCSNKLAINKAIQYSLGYLYNDYTNRMSLVNDQDRMNSLSIIDDSLSRNIAQSISIVNQDIDVYEMLYNKLTFVNATKNASALFSLTNELNNYKKQAKKRY